MDLAIQFNDIDQVKKLLSEGHTFLFWHLRSTESVEMYELIVKHLPRFGCYSVSLIQLEGHCPRWTKNGEWMTYRYISGLLQLGASERYHWPEYFRDFARLEMLEFFRAFLPFDGEAVEFALEYFPLLTAPLFPQLIIIDDCRKMGRTRRARQRKHNILYFMYNRRKFDSLAYEATVLLLHGKVFFRELIRNLHSYI